MAYIEKANKIKVTKGVCNGINFIKGDECEYWFPGDPEVCELWNGVCTGCYEDLQEMNEFERQNAPDFN